MDWAEFAKGAGGSVTTVLLFAVWLNYKGVLLWRAQVEREIKVIVDAAAKLDAVRLEQIDEERKDKYQWKDVASSLKVGLDKILDSIDAKKAG